MSQLKGHTENQEGVGGGGAIYCARVKLHILYRLGYSRRYCKIFLKEIFANFFIIILS